MVQALQISLLSMHFPMNRQPEQNPVNVYFAINLLMIRCLLEAKKAIFNYILHLQWNN